jgi:hypothetical protein
MTISRYEQVRSVYGSGLNPDDQTGLYTHRRRLLAEALDGEDGITTVWGGESLERADDLRIRTMAAMTLLQEGLVVVMHEDPSKLMLTVRGQERAVVDRDFDNFDNLDN